MKIACCEGCNLMIDRTDPDDFLHPADISQEIRCPLCRALTIQVYSRLINQLLNLLVTVKKPSLSISQFIMRFTFTGFPPPLTSTVRQVPPLPELPATFNSRAL